MTCLSRVSCQRSLNFTVFRQPQLRCSPRPFAVFDMAHMADGWYLQRWTNEGYLIRKAQIVHHPAHSFIHVNIFTMKVLISELDFQSVSSVSSWEADYEDIGTHPTISLFTLSRTLQPCKDLCYSWEISIHIRSLSFNLTKKKKKKNLQSIFYSDSDLFNFFFYPAGQIRAPQKHKVTNELWPTSASDHHGYSKASITWFMLLIHVAGYSNPNWIYSK